MSSAGSDIDIDMAMTKGGEHIGDTTTSTTTLLGLSGESCKMTYDTATTITMGKAIEQ